MTPPCAVRHKCHECGYMARIRHRWADGLPLLFKHERQTGCKNVAIVDPEETQ